MALRLTIIVICALIIQSGCSQEGARPHRAPPVKVVVQHVDRGDIEFPLIISGNLTYNADTTVSARVAGQVTSLDVRDGQRVTKGQLLITLDKSELKDLVEAASGDLKKHIALLQFNKAEWEKGADLVKGGAISPIEYDRKLSTYHNSMAQVEADRALLAKVRQDLEWADVKAPITGVLSDRYVEKGDWVQRGQRLFVIGDFSPIYLKGFLADKQLARLQAKEAATSGIDAKVTVDAYPGKKFDGTISYLAPAGTPGRVFEVRVYMENADMLLREGMFARARTVPHRLRGVLRVPATALLDIIRTHESNRVFRVNADGTVKLTQVKIGPNDTRHAEILEGLRENDRVVVYGKEVLTSGVRVEPVSTTVFTSASDHLLR
jgi:RND family efflux transporter MFP subunit